MGSPSNGSSSATPGSRDPVTTAILISRHTQPSVLDDSSSDVSSLPVTQIPGTVLFFTPPIGDVAPIAIYQDCVLGTCNCVHLIGGFPCQLKPCRVAQFLFGDDSLSNVSDMDRVYLWEGFMKGFCIVDRDCPSSYLCANYDSITGTDAYQEMSTLLSSEIDSSKMVVSDTQPLCVHSLGAVWKSNGKLRPITDCSRPDNNCINNYMETTFKSFSYNSVDTAVQVLEPMDYMAVIDIASAYRSVNIRAEQSHFQGLSWDFGDGLIWLKDLRLCFGLKCAPNIFNSLSDLVVMIANSLGADRVINYLDDFLVIASDEDTCRLHRSIVTDVLELLGFTIAWKKVTEPDTVCTFLGITIDSVNMELSLPIAKVVKLKDFISTLMSKGVATKKELERVGGLVSHCSYVVRGGRTFSRRIFDLAASYSRRATAIPLDEHIKADFEWWLAFCDIFNGRACIIRDSHSIPLYSDASFLGFGAWMGLGWIYGLWQGSDPPDAVYSACNHFQPPPTFDDPPKNINVYELWPVVAGIHRWAKFFTNSRIHVITDNMQVLAMLNTGRSCNKTCMRWLRELFWLCFVFNMEVHASYIRSEDNHLADALSRLAYNGVAPKCSALLESSNMCCVHLFRTPDDGNCRTPGTTQGCSMGYFNQEIAPISSELLPEIL